MAPNQLMIKDRDKYGAAVVLGSYLFAIPFFPLFFVFVPFFAGVAISTVGLASHADQKWPVIYLVFVACLVFFILLSLGNLHSDHTIVIIYVTPGVVVLSSLIMAKHAKENMSEQTTSSTEGAPF